jgi:hypothetical protein
MRSHFEKQEKQRCPGCLLAHGCGDVRWWRGSTAVAAGAVRAVQSQAGGRSTAAAVHPGPGGAGGTRPLRCPLPLPRCVSRPPPSAPGPCRSHVFAPPLQLRFAGSSFLLSIAGSLVLVTPLYRVSAKCIRRCVVPVAGCKLVGVGSRGLGVRRTGLPDMKRPSKDSFLCPNIFELSEWV